MGNAVNHEFKPYTDNPELCQAELPDSGDTCNAHRCLHESPTHTVMPAQHAPWRRSSEGHHVWESDKGTYQVSPHLTSRTSGGWRIDYPEGGWRRARSAGDAKELAYRHYLGDPDWAAPADENMGRLEKRGRTGDRTNGSDL